MTHDDEPTTRQATAADVPALREFGREVIPAHYSPLIGEAHALAQVRDWWNEDHLRTAVDAGRVVVAERNGRLIGVGQFGAAGDDVAIYKLYVHPEHRGGGIGPMLIDVIRELLPPDTPRVLVEHFAANGRVGAFYEREGFRETGVRQHPSGDPRLAVVWRVRDLAPADPAPGR